MLTIYFNDGDIGIVKKVCYLSIHDNFLYYYRIIDNKKQRSKISLNLINHFDFSEVFYES